MITPVFVLCIKFILSVEFPSDSIFFKEIRRWLNGNNKKMLHLIHSESDIQINMAIGMMFSYLIKHSL